MTDENHLATSPVTLERITMHYEPRPARIADYLGIVTLLSECALPTGDLSPQKLENFFVAESRGKIIGVAGFEGFGPTVLLRSVAIEPAWRGRTLAIALIDLCEGAALQAGAKSIYLLTTTADRYFRRIGYSEVARSFVPDAVANHDQFKSLCPASAKCLCKRVA